MRRMFTVLAAAFAVVAFSSTTFAQAPTATEKAPKPAMTKPAKEVHKATVATGKVAKFDAATKTLTVTTKKGDENFTLNGDTKIMAGAKAAKEDELAAGKNVKVAYSDNAGQMTATKVTIAAAAKHSKKAEKK
jgi:hypothetical protein